MSSNKCMCCEKLFSNKYNLKRHMDSHICQADGRQLNFEDALFKCLEGCKISFTTSNDLRNHLTSGHSFNIEKQCLDFNSFEEFEVWKQNEEKINNIRFFKARGVKRSSNNLLEKMYLYWSRTGRDNRLTPEDTRQRSMRSQGSSKINFGCTSQIVLSKELLSGKYSIVYYTTHYGHLKEIQHINVSQQCRKEVSLKLLMGVPPNRILDSIREGINGDLNRDDILTRKDIQNIKTSYRININEGCRHQDDSTSVHLWVKECMGSQSSPILFFKPQGERSSKFNLGANAMTFALYT